MEDKGNPASNETGNIALETDILDISKAHYFLIAYVQNNKWGERVLDRQDIYTLLNATKLTINGRVHRYPRVAAGQYGRPSALVPIPDLLMCGVPVARFIKSLTQ